MTTLEKAAKAMHDSQEAFYAIATSWEDENCYVKTQWTKLARAAIESLRTPGAENSDRIFNAMLDRILKEGV